MLKAMIHNVLSHCSLSEVTSQVKVKSVRFQGVGCGIGIIFSGMHVSGVSLLV